MTGIIDQFGSKRCQKKRKDVDYQLLLDFFQKYFVVHERSAVKNSFSKYVWSKVDSSFCEAVYVTNNCSHSIEFCSSIYIGGKLPLLHR